MAGNALHFMTNANVYLDGNSLIGRAKEIKLPEINVVQQEHQALGMIGKIQLPAGFDKLEGEIHWTSLYEEVALRTANPFKAYPLQCRGSLQRYNPAQGRQDELPVAVFMTVMFSKNSLGSFKQHEVPEMSSSFTCSYIKQVMDGQVLLELDVIANIFKINGEDMLTDYRANLGA
ncbi:phage major tail tube protein [Candidatus Arsenophonus nilaparvatae]|uniref:phage major tail tube protein n=1 Tax=Candidatus Arsenophonus nilaparvatae TaxID=1247023 RepID=UPI000509B79B|nr:phage major tail tube protein [Candidatus Arsenophonus nilaparvatae]